MFLLWTVTLGTRHLHQKVLQLFGVSFWYKFIVHVSPYKRHNSSKDVNTGGVVGRGESVSRERVRCATMT